MTLKIEALEKEVSFLTNENEQYRSKERNLLYQIQELERKYQSKEAEVRIENNKF